MKVLKLTGLLLFLFFPLLIRAFEPLDVVLNEIAWMGGASSSNDEWVELFNNTSTTLDVSGWKLYSPTEKLKITLKGKIPARGFFLLERTDDNSVFDVLADQLYQGALNNKGESLKLIDQQGNIVDELNCSDGWFAGNNQTKQTMERINSLYSTADPENWHSSQGQGGTPKQSNTQALNLGIENLISNPQEERVISASPIQSLKNGPKESLKVVFPENVFLNEVLPSPEGPDAENEWLEIYNANNVEVDLSFWQIRDKIGVTKTYQFPEGTKIRAKDFLLCPRVKTGISLQNSGDGLEFLNPTGEIVHQLNYEAAPQGQSFNREGQAWQWSIVLTPGKTNAIQRPQTSSQEESLEAAPEKKEQGTSSIVNYNQRQNAKMLAKIEKTISRSLNPLIVFLIALGLAIASGLIVLFLKKRQA